MNEPPIKITDDRVFLVEGKSDRDFFRAVFDANRRTRGQVESYGGKTRLRSRLRALTGQSDFQENCRWLGVSRDADSSVDDAFRAIADALNYAKQPVPLKLADAASDTSRMVRIFIFSGAGGGKELEDVIWDVLQEARLADTKCVENYFACLESARGTTHFPRKAFLYAYLSSFDPPDRSLDSAALALDAAIPLSSELYTTFLDLIPNDDEIL